MFSVEMARANDWPDSAQSYELTGQDEMMQRGSGDQFLDKIVELLSGRVGDLLQGIVLFGSMATGHANETSDVDLLLVVEPGPESTWTSSSNIALRLQLDMLFRGAPRKVDLWVRTASQASDAGAVFGGVEYLAWRDGRVLYQRPLQFKIMPPRPHRQIIVGHVEDALDDAVRLYAAAIRAPDVNDAVALSRECQLATRSAERAVMACMIVHQRDTLRKVDAPAIILEKLACVEPELARELAGWWTPALRVREAEHIVRAVVAGLSRVPYLRRLTHACNEALALPREQLVGTPSLKDPRHALQLSASSLRA